MMRIAFRIGDPEDYIDRLIKFVTRDKCYHCELVFSNNMVFGASPSDGGTRFTTIKDLDNREKWRVHNLEWITKEEEQLIMEICKHEEGCKYDWIALLLGPFIALANSTYRWFCTEFCLHALRSNFKYVQDRWYTPIQLNDAINTEVFLRRKEKDIDLCITPHTYFP